MVMTCCLMVYAALEHLIQKRLAETGSYFPDMKKKPYQKPTARWVFYNCQGIHELVITTDSIQIFISKLDEKHLTLLECLGAIYKKIYSGS